MHLQAIQRKLKTDPFEPVEFALSNGDRFLVRHPKNVMLLKERVAIAYFEEPGELPDRLMNVSYPHVAAIEPATRKRKSAGRR